MLEILRRRNFALVWLGGLASLTGDWALIAGLPLVVYQMTGSTLALGLTAALLPRLVESEDLLVANTLNGLNTNLARLAGPSLGAVLVSLAGIGGVVLVDAGSFLVAALLLLFVRLDARPEPSPGGRSAVSVWRDWLAGLNLVRWQTTPRIVFVFLAITGVGEGIMGTLFVAFTQRVLHGDDLTVAWLISAQAIGGVLGGLVLLMVLVGGPFAAITAGYMTLAQTAVEDTFRGRLLGLFFAVIALSGIVGMLLGGLLGDTVGIIPMLTFDSITYVAGGSLVLVVLGRRPAMVATRACSPFG